LAYYTKSRDPAGEEERESAAVPLADSEALAGPQKRRRMSLWHYLERDAVVNAQVPAFARLPSRSASIPLGWRTANLRRENGAVIIGKSVRSVAEVENGVPPSPRSPWKLLALGPARPWPTSSLRSTALNWGQRRFLRWWAATSGGLEISNEPLIQLLRPAEIASIRGLLAAAAKDALPGESW